MSVVQTKEVWELTGSLWLTRWFAVPVTRGFQAGIFVNTTHLTDVVPFDRAWLHSRISKADLTMMLIVPATVQRYQQMIDRSLLVAGRIKQNVPGDPARRPWFVRRLD
jgi:hypothetical protein